MIYEKPSTFARESQPSRRWSWRGAVLGLAAIVGLGGLTACDHLDGEVGQITESFQKRLDEKDKELATLRASESSLRMQLSELQGRTQAQSDGGGGRSTVDVAALARELAPLLAAGRSEGVHRTEAPAAPLSPAAPITAPSEQGLPKLELSEPTVRSKGDVPRGRSANDRPSGEVRLPSGKRSTNSFEPVAR